MPDQVRGDHMGKRPLGGIWIGPGFEAEPGDIAEIGAVDGDQRGIDRDGLRGDHAIEDARARIAKGGDNPPIDSCFIVIECDDREGVAHLIQHMTAIRGQWGIAIHASFQFDDAQYGKDDGLV